MNGFGQMQLTEYNGFPGMTQVAQQPQQKEFDKKQEELDKKQEELDKKLKKEGITKSLFDEILTRVKLAFGIKNNQKVGNNSGLVCKFALKIEKCNMYEKHYHEVDDFFTGCEEEDYSVEEVEAERIKMLTLSLGDKSISYSLFDDPQRECHMCYNKGHYFAHKGSCEDYALFDVVNASRCALCELKIEHPEKINRDRCPVDLKMSANNAKLFCKYFLIEVLYKMVSGLDFLDDNYVGSFNETVTKHVRDRYKSENNHVCTICKKAGGNKCHYDSEYPRYCLKKTIETEREKWYKNFVEKEFIKEFSGGLRDKYEKLLMEGRKSEAEDLLYNRAKFFYGDTRSKSVYKQCMNALKIIVENMVKIDIWLK